MTIYSNYIIRLQGSIVSIEDPTLSIGEDSGVGQLRECLATPFRQTSDFVAAVGAELDQGILRLLALNNVLLKKSSSPYVLSLYISLIPIVKKSSCHC